MQKKMLAALGLCFAITASAQTAPSDTIAITPFAGVKVLLVGNSMERLIKENNFELQKNQFVTDMKEAAKESAFQDDPKQVIYLVAPDGRRRLKAKPEELGEFDTKKEIQLFATNLPPFHYTIFDLQRQFEYHIFLTKPQQLENFSTINFISAIEALKAKEKHPNRFNRIDVEIEGTDWQIAPVAVGRRRYYELSTNIAVNLYNSTLAPGLGINADLIWLDKHGIPKYKLGSSISVQAISEYQDFQFKNVHGALCSDMRFMWNVARTSNRPVWTGFLFGRLRSGMPESTNVKYVLADRFKFGISSEAGFIGMDYSIIPPKGAASTLHNLTFRFRF